MGIQGLGKGGILLTECRESCCWMPDCTLNLVLVYLEQSHILIQYLKVRECLWKAVFGMEIVVANLLLICF